MKISKNGKIARADGGNIAPAAAPLSSIRDAPPNCKRFVEFFAETSRRKRSEAIADDIFPSALHVEDGAFGWAVESVFGPQNRFGASSKAARLEAEKREFRGNETGLYFRGIATGGAQECVYAENKRDAQILDGAKVEVDAPNVEKK